MSEIQNRLDRYRQIAEVQYRAMAGKELKLNLTLAPEQISPAACIGRKKIFIPLLFLLRPEEIPEQLLPTGPNDPILSDASYYRVLKTWLQNTFDLEANQLKDLPKFLKPYLHLWKDPEMIERMNRFALAHEVSHIYHNHQTGNWDRYCALIITFVVSMLFIEVPFFSWFLLTYSVFTLSSLALSSIRQYSERQHEVQADQTALKITQDLPAAVALFSRLDAFSERQWEKIPLWQKVVITLSAPSYVLHLSHPSNRDRIRYLTESSLASA